MTGEQVRPNLNLKSNNSPFYPLIDEFTYHTQITTFIQGFLVNKKFTFSSVCMCVCVSLYAEKFIARSHNCTLELRIKCNKQ